MSPTFVEKSYFKATLSFNSSRLWTIPSFGLDAAVSHHKKNFWLYGEAWITAFPKLTDGLKIALIEALLPLSTHLLVILEKGLFEEIWSPLQHKVLLLTEGLRLSPPFPLRPHPEKVERSFERTGVITNTKHFLQLVEKQTGYEWKLLVKRLFMCNLRLWLLRTSIIIASCKPKRFIE